MEIADLVGAGGGREEDDLADPVGELVEGEGPVVEGGGQAEAVLDEGVLAGAVALVLAVDLGDGHVGLVDDGEEVLGEEVEQGVGRLPRLPAVEVAAVVLDAVDHAHLGQHLQVVLGPQPEALGLQQLVLLLEDGQPLPQLDLDGLDGPPGRLVPGHVVGGGEDDQLLQIVAQVAGEGVELADPLHRVAEELDADGLLLVGRVDLDGVAPDPEAAPAEDGVVAVVVEVDQTAEDGPLVDGVARLEDEDPVPVLVG